MKNLIFKKIPLIMADCTAIKKNKKNTMQGYMFRGIDDLYNGLHDIFAKHKVFLSSVILSEKREERQTKAGGVMTYTILTIKFTFYAEDGSNFSSIMIGEAADSGDKSSNKAMSTALKYALMQLLLIPTEDEKDTEFHSPEFVEKKPLLQQKSQEKTEIKSQIYTCSKCACLIDEQVFNFSTKKLGKALCRECQKKETAKNTTYIG